MDPQQLPKPSKVYSKSKKCDTLGSPKVKAACLYTVRMHQIMRMPSALGTVALEVTQYHFIVHES